MASAERNGVRHLQQVRTRLRAFLQCLNPARGPFPRQHAATVRLGHRVPVRALAQVVHHERQVLVDLAEGVVFDVPGRIGAVASVLCLHNGVELEAHPLDDGDERAARRLHREVRVVHELRAVHPAHLRAREMPHHAASAHPEAVLARLRLRAVQPELHGLRLAGLGGGERVAYAAVRLPNTHQRHLPPDAVRPLHARDIPHAARLHYLLNHAAAGGTAILVDVVKGG